MFRQLGLGRYPREAFTAGALTVPGNVRIELWEVAAFDVPGFRLVRILSGSEAVWYDPQGHVLKRISPSQP